MALRLNKKLWLIDGLPVNNKRFVCAWVSLTPDQTGVMRISWNDVIKGRKIAIKKGLVCKPIKDSDLNDSPVRFTELGRNLMKLTQ